MGRLFTSLGEGGNIVSKKQQFYWKKRMVLGVPPISTVGKCRPLQLISSTSIIDVLLLSILLSIFSNVEETRGDWFQHRDVVGVAEGGNSWRCACVWV